MREDVEFKVNAENYSVIGFEKVDEMFTLKFRSLQ